MIRTAFLAALSLLFVVLAPAGAHAQAAPIELKIASLAPKGSAWAKILEKGGKDIEARTQGRVKIKYYFSGQQGDERDVVRKMSAGQLDGAAITAVGLGLIKSDVRVLDLPMLFTNDKQLDYVRDSMRADFDAQFDQAGYVLLAWGDVGWVHIYTSQQITSKEVLGKEKMWEWKDDPIIGSMFKKLGINGVPLGVPEVLTSLNTGAITGCYGSPLVAVALQWYSKIKFASKQPVSYSIGAVVVRKEVFAKLSAEDQKTLREASASMGKDLIAAARKDNGRAKTAMEGAGIKFVDLPAPMQADLDTGAKAVWAEMTGKLFKKDLLDKVLKFRDEARKKFP
jgi:TRAP-type C4-dicarboxylate transport system substrate-binding protein